MKKTHLFLLVGAILALLAATLGSSDAQEVGGVIIEGNFGGDPGTFNPILASDTASARITEFLFPRLIGVNPETGLFEANRPDALVSAWDISDDGRVYTFTLKDDWTWSDGTPITTDDVLYTWNSIRSRVVETDLVFVLDSIERVEAPDAYTLVVTFKSADCAALNNAAVLVPVPSHALPANFAELNDAAFNVHPTVIAGVFRFGEFRPGEQVSLLANPDYAGAAGVVPAGFVYKVVPDQTVLVEQFLAGETNVIDGPSVNRRSDLRAAAQAGDIQVYDYPGNAWDYLAFNLADPLNPHNGLDGSGSPIDQGHHPLFGDARVRQAIARAIDVDAMIDGAVFGEGERMTSVMIPTSWAYDHDLPPIAYDPEAAAALLDEAGWIDHDNNPSTPRIADGALYVEDGTEFRFILTTNQGGTRREALGTIVQDQLSQVGIAVEFQSIDFSTLLDITDGQVFDALILGWRNGYPDDPDLTQLFTPVSDVVGSGSNFTSYNNPSMTALNTRARTLPGCDPADRAPLYHQIQAIMQQDLPYIPLYAINGMYAARSNVEGFAPYPSQLYWNVASWAVAEAN